MNGRIIVGRCIGCGAELEEKDIEPYGQSECHVVPNCDQDGDWYPEPCGPVNRIMPPKEPTDERL